MDNTDFTDVNVNVTTNTRVVTDITPFATTNVPNPINVNATTSVSPTTWVRGDTCIGALVNYPNVVPLHLDYALSNVPVSMLLAAVCLSEAPITYDPATKRFQGMAEVRVNAPVALYAGWSRKTTQYWGTHHFNVTSAFAMMTYDTFNHLLSMREFGRGRYSAVLWKVLVYFLAQCFNFAGFNRSEDQIATELRLERHAVHQAIETLLALDYLRITQDYISKRRTRTYKVNISLYAPVTQRLPQIYRHAYCDKRLWVYRVTNRITGATYVGAGEVGRTWVPDDVTSDLYQEVQRYGETNFKFEVQAQLDDLSRYSISPDHLILQLREQTSRATQIDWSGLEAALTSSNDYVGLARRFQLSTAAVVTMAARTQSCLMTALDGTPQAVYTNLEDAADFLVVYQKVPADYAMRGIIGAIAYRRQCCGHNFQLVPDNSVEVSYCDPTQLVPTNDHLRPVVNVECGRRFENALEAAHSQGRRSDIYILRCCQGARKTAYGYHWKFAD